MDQEKNKFLKYVIFLHSVEGTVLDKDLHKAHAEHLRKLDEDGRLVLAGPFVEHNSGMIIINAGSKDEAKEIAEADPFIIHDYRKYEIRTLEYCCSENNYQKPK